MKKIFIIIFSLTLFNSIVHAQIRRALLIGINKYNPENVEGARWRNLDGCINDIISVNEILQAKFGFSKDNITILKNDEADRNGIISGFNKLLNDSKKGDVVVLYYSGHGSQVRNSLSTEFDKKDESMVPADIRKGAKDIRDKELAVIFNKFIDKGIIITSIFDCCHSGSIARGELTNEPPKLRYVPEVNIDVKDSTHVVPPENRGMLVMSASQDDEFASEQVDANGTPHGAFTIALMQTLTTLPSNASVINIFSSVRAILKYNAKPQEPVLAGTDSRKKQTLFGIDKSALSNKIMIAVINKDDSLVKLQGGLAIGINVNSELIKKEISGEATKIKVISVNGINTCMARVILGDIKNIKAGDLFELTSFISGAGASLKIYIPKSDFDYNNLFAIAQNLYKLSNNKNYTIILDPFKDSPTHTIFFNEKKWFIGMPDGKSVEIGVNPDVNNISKLIPAGAKVMICIPPTKEFYSKFITRFDNNSSVELAKEASEAQYYLEGRMKNGKLEYAFVEPMISSKDTAFESTMPIRTDFNAITNDANSANSVTDSLEEYSYKLAKIKAWLTMSGPADDGSFPFYLGLKNAKTKNIISNGKVVKGDTLGLVLLTDKENEQYWNGTKRYVYVIALNNEGKIQLAYPLNGSVENRLPRMSSDGNVMSEMPLGPKRLITVEEPLGVDTYIMLTTEEPLPSPELFNQSSVITRGRGDAVGLEQLFNIGSKTRAIMNTPINWSVHRLSVKSIAK